VSDSEFSSRRANLHYRLNIRPGVPLAQEVVTICQLRWDRQWPGLIIRTADRVLPLRPGWIVPLYLALEALHSALTPEQREKWLPVGIAGAGWRLSYQTEYIVSKRIEGGVETLPPVLASINRKYEARVLNTCSCCGGSGQLYPECEGLLRDVLCKKCAAPRLLIVGMSQLCNPVWIEAEGKIHLQRPKLPSPWRQALLRWSIGSGISPQSITPAIYMEWMKALLPAARAIAERGKQHYHQIIHEEMDDILFRLSEFEYA
jgi:hypothetical protein